jgi:hypothetical protein
MNFARVLAESGLSKIELAALYGISRQSIHGWAIGRPPRGLLARQAETITQALLALLDKRVLPMEAMDKGARRARIEKMAAKLQGLKPAPIR